MNWSPWSRCNHLQLHLVALPLLLSSHRVGKVLGSTKNYRYFRDQCCSSLIYCTITISISFDSLIRFLRSILLLSIYLSIYLSICIYIYIQTYGYCFCWLYLWNFLDMYTCTYIYIYICIYVHNIHVYMYICRTSTILLEIFGKRGSRSPEVLDLTVGLEKGYAPPVLAAVKIPMSRGAIRGLFRGFFDFSWDFHGFFLGSDFHGFSGDFHGFWWVPMWGTQHFTQKIHDISDGKIQWDAKEILPTQWDVDTCWKWSIKGVYMDYQWYGTLGWTYKKILSHDMVPWGRWRNFWKDMIAV